MPGVTPPTGGTQPIEEFPIVYVPVGPGSPNVLVVDKGVLIPVEQFVPPVPVVTLQPPAVVPPAPPLVPVPEEPVPEVYVPKQDRN